MRTRRNILLKWKLEKALILTLYETFHVVVGWEFCLPLPPLLLMSKLLPPQWTSRICWGEIESVAGVAVDSFSLLRCVVVVDTTTIFCVDFCCCEHPKKPPTQLCKEFLLFFSHFLPSLPTSLSTERIFLLHTVLASPRYTFLRPTATPSMCASDSNSLEKRYVKCWKLFCFARFSTKMTHDDELLPFSSLVEVSFGLSPSCELFHYLAERIFGSSSISLS